MIRHTIHTRRSWVTKTVSLVHRNSTTLRLDCLEHRVVTGSLLPLTLEGDDMRVILSKLELTRCLSNRVFWAECVLKHALVFSKLALEVKIAEIAWRSISAWSWCAESWVSTLLMASSCCAYVLCDC